MPVTRADLITRLRNPAKGTAETQKTILITGSACADMKEAAEAIERLRSALVDCIDSLEYVDRAQPGFTGWGVRAARIATAKIILRGDEQGEMKEG